MGKPTKPHLISRAKIQKSSPPYGKKMRDIAESSQIYNGRIIMSIRGTDKLKVSYDLLLELLSKGKETLGDGFQISDTFALIGIIKTLTQFGGSIAEAVEDVKDLDSNELQVVIEDFISKGMEVIYSKGTGANNLGTNAVYDIVSALHEIAYVSKDALADGVQLSDIQYLPKIISLIVVLITQLPQAMLELSDLVAEEIAEVLGVLASKIMHLLSE